MEIKITQDEAKAGINGFEMKDGSMFVLRNVQVAEDATTTTVSGLFIETKGRGTLRVFELKGKVSSYSEAVERLKNEGY